LPVVIISPEWVVIDNKVIEQVNLFNYLGNISYEKELNIDNQLHN